MKLIQLRSNEVADLATAGLIRTCCGFNQQGMSVAEMRSRLRVLDALDGCDGSNLLLEDADHQALVDALAATRWLRVSREIVQFEDDVKDAKAPPAVMVAPDKRAAAA